MTRWTANLAANPNNVILKIIKYSISVFIS